MTQLFISCVAPIRLFYINLVTETGTALEKFQMRLVLFVVCLFVYFVSLSADLSIGVTYISKQGVNVYATSK